MPRRKSPYVALRRVTQALMLVLFLWLFLQTEGKGLDELGPPVRLFLDFDPLILLSTLLASHTASVAFWFSLATVLVTLVLGRVFCGWLCPFGTLHSMVSSLRSGPVARTAPPLNLHYIKYLILALVLISALFGAQLAGMLDPISLLIRSLSVSVYPAVSSAAFAVFDTLYEAKLPVISAASEALYSRVREPLLPFEQPHYRQAVFIGLLFALLLGLNFIERRFWCRNLCPLGALLGLLSRFSLLSRTVSEGCTQCGACGYACPSGAHPERPGEWKKEECYYCFNCDDRCLQQAVRFGFFRTHSIAPMDIGRRRVLASVALGAATVPLLRSSEVLSAPNPRLIRPPGSRSEAEFLSRCVRCGECMKVCLTNGLQPTFLEAGPEGLWTPMLVPRMGYCEFRCTLCGQVCPTGAIERLSIEKKTKTVIGLAMVDRNRCLPWAHGKPCIVCEEMCPTPQKAILLELATVRDAEGRETQVQRPVMNLELCIGCGICEAQCPIAGKPGIYVTSTGEQRNERMRLFLEQ